METLGLGLPSNCTADDTWHGRLKASCALGGNEQELPEGTEAVQEAEVRTGRLTMVP